MNKFLSQYKDEVIECENAYTILIIYYTIHTFK
jgi:hypothetical protein